MLVARMFGFKEAEFFEVDEATREAGAPQVDFGTAGGSGATAPAGGAPAPSAGGATTPPPPADDVPEPPGQPTPPNPTG